MEKDFHENERTKVDLLRSHITRNKQDVTGVGFGSSGGFILDLYSSQIL